MTQRDDLYYDFDRDAWIEVPGIHARWSERELPTPALPPAPGVWLRPPGRFRKEYLQLSLAWMGVALLLIALVAHRFLLLPLAGGVIGLAHLVAIFGCPPRAADRRLLEDPDDLDVCLVDIRINRDRRPVGLDRGVAWFEGGRLMFNGHRTSFAIGGEDILPRSQWHPLQRERVLILPLRVAGGKAVVVFDFVTGAYNPGERERRFVERLHAFRQRPPVSRGPRQFPPLQ